jgi:hypothetical protein
MRHVTPIHVAEFLGLEEPYVHELCRVRWIPRSSKLRCCRVMRPWRGGAGDRRPRRRTGPLILSGHAPAAPGF